MTSALNQIVIRRLDSGAVRFHNYDPQVARFIPGRTEVTMRALVESLVKHPSNLSLCALQGQDFEGAQLKNGRFDYSDFSGSDLSRADLTNASLRGVKMYNVNMTAANLTLADMRGVQFRPLPGTFDPMKSLGVPPTKGLAKQVAKAYLSKGNAKNVSFLAFELAGPAGIALAAVTSVSMAAAILLPGIAHLYGAGSTSQAEWCRSTLNRRKALAA